METLSPRQQSILNRVIDSHIETGQPVASKYITDIFTEIYRDSYSSATVRHEMGILERLGYLTHPHTSAGRVPTDLGYRYYVDHSMRPEASSEGITKQSRVDFSDDETDSGIMEKASQIMASRLKEVGVTLLITSQGGQILPKVSRYFYVQGAAHLLEKPEFRNVEKFRQILDLLESKEELCEWFLDRSHKERVTVVIGRENPLPAFRECGVVFASYFIGDRKKGALAVIGSRRMHYAQAIPVVKDIARTIENFFKRSDPDQDFSVPRG